jgi:O-antigen/teichoic acid export membrane protein
MVGLYGAGVRLVELGTLFLPSPRPIPCAFNMKQHQRALGTRMRYSHNTFTFKYFLATVVSLNAGALINIIFGNEFSDGIPALRIYAWSIIGTFLGQYVINILFTEDQKSILVVTNVIPALINVVLNLWLIPIYGISGAAYATVIAYSITPLIPFIFPSTRKSITDTF